MPDFAVEQTVKATWKIAAVSIGTVAALIGNVPLGLLAVTVAIVSSN